MKLVLLNQKGWTDEFCLQDSNFKKCYKFNCCNCKQVIDINSENLSIFKNLGLNFNEREIEIISGTGSLSKIVICKNCKTLYFVGIGYLEPNYGRDVLVLHNVVELSDNKIQEIIDFACNIAFDGKINDLKLLLDLPININSNGKNWTILHSAIENQHFNCVMLILEKGADYEYKGNCNMSPLEHAIDISVDSNTNSGGKQGDESIEIIKILLDFGANPQTGFRIANSYKSEKILALLTNYLKD